MDYSSLFFKNFISSLEKKIGGSEKKPGLPHINSRYSKKGCFSLISGVIPAKAGIQQKFTKSKMFL